MESKDEKKSYEYEDILEMLGGYTYFEKEQIDYVFYKLNNNMEEADIALNICKQKQQKLINISKKLKTQEFDNNEPAKEFLKEVDKKIESLENTDIQDNFKELSLEIKDSSNR